VIRVRESAEGVTFAVRVQPGAKKTTITGVYSEGESAAVRLAVAAPPIDGRANEAVGAFFAELFGVGRSQVSILYGESSRNKVIRVAGKSAADVEALLNR
jgi:uncharacterized protein